MLIPAAKGRGERQRRLCQVAAVGPPAAGDAVRAARGRCRRGTAPQSATSSIAAKRRSLSSACMNVLPNPPEPRTFGSEDSDARVEQRREQLVVAGAGLAFRAAVQKDHGADGSTPAAGVQPAGELSPSRAVMVSSVGSAATGPLLGARSTRLPFAGPGIDQFDRRRRRRPLHGHRHHRPACADAQFAGHQAGQRNRLAQRVVGVSRICNSLAPLMFHNSATVDRSSLTANSSSSKPGRSATT